MKRRFRVLHVRGFSGNPIGTIAMSEHGSIGLALCHFPLDQFSRKEGRRRAIQRAIEGEHSALGVNPKPLCGKAYGRYRMAAIEAARMARRFQDPTLRPSYFNYEADV